MTNINTDKKKHSLRILTAILAVCFSLFLLFYGIMPAVSQSASQEQPPPPPKVNLLRLLGITASPESIDYIQNKAQFQLHTLLTEQRHPKTWNLSERISRDTQDGLRMLFSVDEDIRKRLEILSPAEKLNMELAVQEVEKAILSKKKIYIYGCGATGRLAKQMESSFWRPFWKKVKETPKVWPKIAPYVAAPIEDQLIGEMTGADRALISSLEGFEDLLLIGRLQLEDRNIRKGDVVICVTEGGETSSVIGTVLAALDKWKEEGAFDPKESRKKLYFVYNNPDEKLLPFVRSRKVLEEPGITKINLATGPQAITGSTRMQATTIETFVIGAILETAVERALGRHLSGKEMEKIGFSRPMSLEERLSEFPSILEEVKKNIPALARFTGLEAGTYGLDRFSTYFAGRALITVFIDSTERSPTFRLFPLDTVDEPKRKCWIQVWMAAPDIKAAWQAFLGRPFRGLASGFYRKPFEEKIDDSYLKRAALTSLERAGDDQQVLYDFSYSDTNVTKRGPGEGDLGVAVFISPEERDLRNEGSAFRKFIRLHFDAGASVALILVTEKAAKDLLKTIEDIAGPEKTDEEKIPVIQLEISAENDPFGLRQQVGLKMLLNAHSTAVMARLGKVIGNTMTNVSPSNLKLIGRATYLIQTHVNDVLAYPEWVKRHGTRDPITYGEANAVLFDAISFLKDKAHMAGQTAEVALSIIRILESVRQNKGVTQEEALTIVQTTGLSRYLATATQKIP